MPGLFRALRNAVAATVLDAVIARVPFHNTADPDEEKPTVWGYVIKGPDGSPYLTRVLFPRIPAGVPLVGGVRPMLHKFHRPDADRDCHNHPWNWAASVVLAGEYVEERLDIDATNLAGTPRYTSRVVRWFNTLTDADYHRILELRGEVYTLFCTGKRTQSWGFLDYVSGKHTDWQDYLRKRGLAWSVETATGEALDKIADLVGLERFTLGPKYATDAAYRKRIKRVLDGK